MSTITDTDKDRAHMGELEMVNTSRSARGRRGGREGEKGEIILVKCFVRHCFDNDLGKFDFTMFQNG